VLWESHPAVSARRPGKVKLRNLLYRGMTVSASVEGGACTMSGAARFLLFAATGKYLALILAAKP
jgi:hypothetical protein